MSKKIRGYVIISFFMLLFPLFVFAEEGNESISNDGARKDITVCSKTVGDCDYQTLDQALTYLESFHYYDDNIYPPLVYLKDSTTQILTNHTLDVPVAIYGYNYDNDISIDGTGSTISTNYGFYFDADDVSITNLNVVLLNTNYFSYSDFNAVFDFDVNSFSLDNFHLKNEGKDYSCITDISRSLVGVSIETSAPAQREIHERLSFYDASITNSSITNFDIAVDTYREGFYKRIADVNQSMESITEDGDREDDFGLVLTVDKCDFYDNFLSFYLYHTSSFISNSKLSSIVGRDSNVKLLDGNSFGEAKVIKVHSYTDQETMYSDEYYNSLMDDLVQICAMTKNKKNVYIMGSDNNYTTSVVEIHLEKTKEVDSATNQLSMLDQFINTKEVDTSTFVYSSSDESVAKIENGKVVFLKNQDVDITAVSRETYETYVLHLKVNHSLVQNPVTGTILVFIIFSILLFISYVMFLFLKRKATAK